MFFIRLTRVAPFLAFLAVLAVVIYLIARFRFPSARAKQIVIDTFTGISIVLCIVLGLITLMSVLDNNLFAVELFGSFLVAALLGLLIVRLCNRSFLKKYPQYKHRPEDAFVYTAWHKLKDLFNNIKNNQPPIS